MEELKKWAKTYNDIIENKDAVCPFCNSRNLSHTFQANKDRVGFAQIVCNDCEKYFTLSRVIFPDGVEVENIFE